jgi:hypothetical protein
VSNETVVETRLVDIKESEDDDRESQVDANELKAVQLEY